jgi:hypothetical protein
MSQALVNDSCNLSYSGNRDQEDHCLNPAQGSSSRDPVSTIPNTKMAGGVAQSVGPEFKTRYRKKKKKTL